MSQKLKKNHDLGTSPLFPLAMKLAIPTALAQAVNVLYAIIDRMFIGHIERVGDLALAGVGVAAPITTLISSFAVLIGLGGAPIMAMKSGHHEPEQAKAVLSSAFDMLIIEAMILTPLFLLTRESLLWSFGASPETFDYANSYLFWYTLGTPFAILATGLNSYLINQGKSKEGMITVLSGAILNIILDPLFIFTFNLGVKGGAIATIISQAVSAFFTISFLRDRSTPIRLEFHLIRKKTLPLVKKTIVFGLSPFIIISTDSILMIILNMMLQKYGGPGEGDLLITCSTIIQSFHLLVMNPIGGITGGCQGMISYNYGAGNSERVRKGILTVQCIATAYTVLMTLATIFLGRHFITLFTTDTLIIEKAVGLMFIFECMIIPLSFQYNNVDSFTAMGQVAYSLPLSLLRKSLFLIATVSLPMITKKAETAFLAEPICDVTAAAVSSFLIWTRIGKILKKREENGLAF